MYVPQGWTEGTKQGYPAPWLSPHLQQSRRGPQNNGRRAGQSNLAPGLCNTGNMVSEDLGDPPTEWREAKECQGWVCWGYSEEGEVQVEDPGICQLQTSLSPRQLEGMKSLLSLLSFSTLEAGARQVKTFSPGPPVTLHSHFPEYPQALPRHPHPGSTCSLGDIWRDRLTSPSGSYIIAFVLCLIPAKAMSFASRASMTSFSGPHATVTMTQECHFLGIQP